MCECLTSRHTSLEPIRITWYNEGMTTPTATKRTRARTRNNPTTTGFRVSDALWAVLAPLLPVHVNTHRFGGGRPGSPIDGAPMPSSSCYAPAAIGRPSTKLPSAPNRPPMIASKSGSPMACSCACGKPGLPPVTSVAVLIGTG